MDLAYEPYIPESWREMRRAEDEAARAAEASSRVEREAQQAARRSAWMTFFRIVGYALGVLVLLVLVATGIAGAMGRRR